MDRRRNRRRREVSHLLNFSGPEHDDMKLICKRNTKVACCLAERVSPAKQPLIW